MENILAEKINKEKYSEYLKSLVQNIDPKNSEGFSQLGMQSFHYLVENYSNLDSEMQSLTDKISDTLAEQFDTLLKEAPDTIEVRKAKRLLRTIKNELPTASSLIMFLESKYESKEPVIIETRKLFEEYFQHFLDNLYDVSITESHRGTASFAKFSMLFSIVDEMLSAFHMAQHGYINQAYAHIRTVSESLNLIELFIRDESYAELWFSNDERKKKQELKPVNVRKKLGIENDPLYAFLSAHGIHVTKEYVQAKSYKKSEPSQKGNPHIKFFLGGTKIIVHLLYANSGCILALISSFIQLGKSFPARVHEQDYQVLVRKFTKDYIGYLRRYIEFFKEAKINTDEIEAFIDNIDQYLRDYKTAI